MHTYLVGGAVRDQLLKRPVKDKDYVVVGATVQQMLNLGFKQVGKDFPVFLHPQSNEEYALARTEKKAGSGYTGFVCDFSPDITLEQDLHRRDLTINAMAMSDNGDIIDPYNGQRDLNNRILRHVSPAFVEDPLRVFRVARFAARYHHLDFKIADETQTLMQQLADSGEITHLTAERVWQETANSLQGEDPHIYFQTLKNTGALASWFTELDALWGVPNPAKWHPEIDSGVHTLMVLQQAAKLSQTLPVRFAALVHDLGKALTPADKWPSHHGHEKLGLKPVATLCERLKVPNDCRELALLVCEFHAHLHRALELKPASVLKLFNRADAWRRPQRFSDFLTCCEADARGRTGFELNSYPQREYLTRCLSAANDVDVQQIVQAGYQGQAIREQLNKQRIAAISRVKNLHSG